MIAAGMISRWSRLEASEFGISTENTVGLTRRTNRKDRLKTVLNPRGLRLSGKAKEHSDTRGCIVGCMLSCHDISSSVVIGEFTREILSIDAIRSKMLGIGSSISSTR
jgi:hypothetical protein